MSTGDVMERRESKEIVRNGRNERGGKEDEKGREGENILVPYLI